MSKLVDIPPSVLASLLESISECEGVLVCRDTLPAMDDDAVGRCFSTFMFTQFSGGSDNGLNFSHEESGTSLCYTGASVALAIGGEVSDALADLLKVLFQLGWKNIDVYSETGEGLYHDMCMSIPASVDIQLTACDIPVGLSDDMAAFSQQVSRGGGDSSVDQFMSMFSEDAGVPAPSSTSSSAAPSVVAGTQHAGTSPGMGVSVGVASNYIPDDGLDPYDQAPMVPGATPDVVEGVGIQRPLIRLSTASPVAGIDDAVEGKGVDVEKSIQASAQHPLPSPAPSTPSFGAPVVAPVAAPTEDGSGVRAAAGAHAPIVPLVDVGAVAEPPPPSPSPFVKGCLAATPVQFPSDPIYLGDAVVVFDTPGNRLASSVLEQVRAGARGRRDVVWIEPGASVASDQHAGWALFDEIPAGADGLALMRGLVASLWPDDAQAQLQIMALLVLLRAEGQGYGSAVSVSLKNVLDAVLGVEDRSILSRLAAAAQTGGKIAEQMLQTLYRQNQGYVATTTARIVDTLWSVPLLDEQKGAPSLSFIQLAKGGDDRVVVVVLDSLDSGGAAEFLAAGMLRWVTLLRDSRRITASAVEPVSAAEKAAAQILQELPADAVAALSKLLSLKR